ncbi:MAG: hypothetical protein WD004_03365 [Actinomycetota bacterium]
MEPAAPNRSGLGRVARLFRARRYQTEEPHTYRLASSIRLTWGLGLASFLIISIAIGFLVGRVSEDEFRVPKALVDYETGIAQNAAQSVRRSVNEGTDDVTELAQVLALGAGRQADRLVDPDSGEGARVGSVLRTVGEIHGRYLSLYLLSPDGQVVASTGERPRPELLRPKPPFEAPGTIQVDRDPGGAPVILQFAPMPLEDGGSATIVAQYDPEFLAFALEGATPGDGWVVDAEGRVIGSLEPTGFVQLPREPLLEASERAAAGESGGSVTTGGIDHQEIIGYAPVAGAGPAGQLGWSVVTTRSVASLALPQTQVRSQGLLAGLILAFVTVMVFGWLYVVVVIPVLRLQREAERLAFGDLSKPVEIIRYDEIGLIARSLERLRVLLIRKRIRTGAPPSAKTRKGD